MTGTFAAGRFLGGRWGWTSEPALQLYLLAIWAAALQVAITSRSAVARLSERDLLLRPLHQLRARQIAWSAIVGMEQRIGGDRLILHYRTPRGARFVALNLNLVRGRREFVAELERRLRDRGMVERIVDDTRALVPPRPEGDPPRNA